MTKIFATLLGIALLFFNSLSLSAQSTFPKWEKGYLDIHFINTGRGNSSFIVMPDGTTMLVDAGDFNNKSFDTTYAPMYSPAQKPNASFTAGLAIVNYLQNITGEKTPEIDYALITHYHSDHYGSVRNGQATSSKGDYILTGITEVGEYTHIHKLIDRSSPANNFPIDLKNNTTNNGGVEHETYTNYLKYLEVAKKNGMSIANFNVGSNRQFVLKKTPRSYPQFNIRNIKANNLIWNGKGDNETNTLFSSEKLLGNNGKYNENILSTAFLISYGDFKYFDGGDNPGLIDQDRQAWQDVETPMSKVVGEVDVTTLCHHGNRDATNANFLNALNPKVVISQAWSPDHPGAEVAQRLISPNIGTKERDIYMTYFCPETSIGIGPWYERNLKSGNGHIVVRVFPDSTYKLFVLDDTKTELIVINESETHKATKKQNEKN